MSVASNHVTLFRTLWADRFVDTVTVTDLTTRGTWNRATKQYDTAVTAEVYSGSALIRPGSSAASSRSQSQTVTDFVVLLPHTATGIQPGNVVTVTGLGATSDQDLSGAVFTVESVTDDTYDTHTVLDVNRKDDVDRG